MSDALWHNNSGSNSDMAASWQNAVIRRSTSGVGTGREDKSKQGDDHGRGRRYHLSRNAAERVTDSVLVGDT